MQAVSPPFIDGGGVRFEQWWYGYPKEQTLHDIRYMEREYAGDAIFFEFLEYWLRNDLVDSAVKAELRGHLIRLPVWRCEPNVYRRETLLILGRLLRESKRPLVDQ